MQRKRMVPLVLAAVAIVPLVGRVAFSNPNGSPTSNRERVGYRWRQTATSLALRKDGRTVWRLNHDKNQGTPFFHPVCLVDGTELTWDRPPDHPWHHGLWFSWKYINGVSYWDEDPNTGLAPGRDELVAIKAVPHHDHSATIEMTLLYHQPGRPAVLTEIRKIHVSAPDADGRYRMDWTATFTAGSEDVVFDRTPLASEPQGKPWGGYAGLSVRIAQGISQWQVVNSEGEKNMQAHGRAARWMDFSGQTTEGAATGITIFDHPQNVRYPAPWYVAVDTEVPFGYFSPAVLFHEPYTLRAGKSFTLKYRVLVHPGKISPKSLEAEARSFTAMQMKRK